MKNRLLFLLLLVTASVYAQSVEDTIRYQLGYKLHFYGKTPPPQNISVIKVKYFAEEKGYDYPNDVYYCYINHDKNHVGYKYFSVDFLEKKYNKYFSSDSSSDLRDDPYVEVYNDIFERNKKVVGGVVYIDSLICDYEGYWVYLKKYKEDYYLHQSWDFIYSFRILPDRIDALSFDGPMPCVLAEFKVIPDSEFKVSFGLSRYVDFFSFKLIDKKRQIYQNGKGEYATPASNSKNFEMIQYANRSGDCIFPFIVHE